MLGLQLFQCGQLFGGKASRQAGVRVEGTPQAPPHIAAHNTKTYFEAALLIAMLGFISTVAVCKYLLRGDIIE